MGSGAKALLLFLVLVYPVCAQTLVNISAQSPVASGGSITCGFVVTGGSKTVLIRAIGPSLSGFGVASPLPHPTLRLFKSPANSVVASNSGWGGSASLAAVFQQVGAFTLDPASLDAALVATLPTGSYTAQASDAASGSGQCLIEIYDAGGAGSELVNLSALLGIGTGTTTIGFVVSPGPATRRLLVRAVGPGLATFGLTGLLPDPALAVFNATSQSVVALNNDWSAGNASTLAATFDASGAFPLTNPSKDAALVADFSPGSYGIQVAGNGSTSGTALIELYDVTAAVPNSVTVAATQSQADNSGNHPGAIVVSRVGDLSHALTVSYSESGTAAPGIDYPALAGSATLPANVAAVTVGIAPYPKANAQSTTSVTVTALPGSGYTVGAPAAATVTISNLSASPAMIAPNFLLSADSPFQTVEQGSYARLNASVVPLSGFSGSVLLAVTGLPAGATATLAPATINSSGVSAVTVATSASTPAGTYTLALTATTNNPNLAFTVPLSLTVTASAALQQAVQVVGQMSLSEKISQVHGSSSNRFIQATTNAPLYNFTNGPAGACNAGPGHQGSATALPAPISLAATFDRSLAYLYGTVVGEEARDYSNTMIEGPDINIARVPQNGRTFEAYGEDPYLVGQIAVNDIEGIQDQGINAESKHFAANNQETNRMTINEIIDERALREIYLPAFEATVKEARVDAVMGAYNQVNGTFSCENPLLLQQILRNEWGFDGYTTSDFGAVHSTVASALAGMDAEMPTVVYYGSALQTAVQAGQVPGSVVDQMLILRFRKMIERGVFSQPPPNTALPSATDGLIARQIAEAGMVLLKNNGALLPLSTSRLHSIALIGPAATAAKTGGGGSSAVTPIYTVAPLPGLQARVGAAVTVKLDSGSSLTTAAVLAATSDVAIVMVGDNEAEGADDSLSLGGNQDQLVQAVVAANPNTIVVLKSGTAILMPWASQVPAILEAWYPGEEDGNAVAAVLFGDVNPSGKLPLTFPVNLADLPANTPSQYPGVNGVATYSEGVFVGYRHYDSAGIAPLFPFGHGLSYTTFQYQNLVVSAPGGSFLANPGETVGVDFDITNIGPVAGSEVAQIYVGKPSLPMGLADAPQWLKGFQKVTLAPGETGHVHATLDFRAFSYWDVATHGWQLAPGSYTISVGSSSRDVRLTGQVPLN